MAAASSEGSPTTPISNNAPSERNFSRSSSISSIFDDFQWTPLLVSRPKNRNKKAKGRDPVAIERSNLLNISKLVVKELIEQSLRFGRMLDSDHMPLQHFFIVLEHVLRHGLRLKKGLLGPKKELWDILQLVEKYAPEAQDITSSVRDLPTVRTHTGRARAWLRLALMQKKLADYLKVLIDHKDETLVEFYEPDALMLSDEVIIIIGLLVGLNVIDCNLCVKEEDLDCLQGVIDFSLYLRSSSQVTEEDNNEEQGEDNMIAVLDQKSYMEELNRHLNATVTNLQSKVESLTTENALMKEDLSITKNHVYNLFEENRMLKKELGKEDAPSDKKQNRMKAKRNSSASMESNGSGGRGGDTTEIEELKKQLEEEQNARQEAEKELDLQMCLKAEMEMAMKLLEKDIHEKQDTIISLRRQLEEIKLINLEMYKKLQDSEGSLKHKTEFVSKLEAKIQSMTESMQFLDAKFRESEAARANVEQKRQELGVQAAHQEELTNTYEGDLKVERDWRVSLQDTLQQERERTSKLQQELTHLRTVAQKYALVQEEYYNLKEHCLEQEQTLEELGAQLSASKLQISDLKEEVTKTKTEGTWVNDKDTTHCKSCNKEFNVTRRKHHCRNCGEIFCKSCSDNSSSLPSSAKPVRVCDNCYVLLLGRNSAM